MQTEDAIKSDHSTSRRLNKKLIQKNNWVPCCRSAAVPTFASRALGSQINLQSLENDHEDNRFCAAARSIVTSAAASTYAVDIGAVELARPQSLTSIRGR